MALQVHLKAPLQEETRLEPRPTHVAAWPRDLCADAVPPLSCSQSHARMKRPSAGTRALQMFINLLLSFLDVLLMTLCSLHVHVSLLLRSLSSSLVSLGLELGCCHLLFQPICSILFIGSLQLTRSVLRIQFLHLQ